MTIKLFLLIEVIILICQFIYVLPFEGMKKLLKLKEEIKKCLRNIYQMHELCGKGSLLTVNTVKKQIQQQPEEYRGTGGCKTKYKRENCFLA